MAKLIFRHPDDPPKKVIAAKMLRRAKHKDAAFKLMAILLVMETVWMIYKLS